MKYRKEFSCLQHQRLALVLGQLSDRHFLTSQPGWNVSQLYNSSSCGLVIRDKGGLDVTHDRT